MRKNIKISIILFCIILFSFLIRFNTFWLSHWSGDQENYLALAMKLDHFGLDGYNLRGVNVRTGSFSLHGEKTLLIGEVVPDEKDKKGLFLKLRESVGITQYDIPLYYLAPGFPYALMISHRIFSSDTIGYRAPAISLDHLVKKIKPPQYFTAQFYAVIVPLIFSMLLIILTFFIGREIFSEKVGIYAAFMMSINSVDIVCSQRIWPADMVSSLVALTVITFIIAIRKRSIYLSVFSGIIFGLSILTRQNVVLIFIPLWVYAVLIDMEKRKEYLWKHILLNRETTVFLVAALFVSSFWFIKTFMVYGTPIYDTAENLKEMMADNKTGFYKTMLERPSIPVLYMVGIPYLSPVFALAYITLKELFVSGEHKKRIKLIFLWLWIVIIALFLAIFRPISREHRYMLPVYPAIAILSGYALTKIKSLFTRLFGDKYIVLSDIFIVVLLLLSAIWSIHIGIDEAITNKSFILKPF